MAITLNSTLNEIVIKDCASAEYRDLWNRDSQVQTAQVARLSSERANKKIPCELSGLVRKGDKVLVLGSALEKKRDINYLVYSSHNGVHHGKRYFFCPRGHGVMVKSSDVKPLCPVLRTWPLNGNHMFPSYEGVKRRRKQRQLLIKGAEEALHKEHEMKRRAQMERFSKSAKQLSASDQDYLTRGSQKQSQGIDEESFQELQLQKLKKAFGGDEKAERMVETLRKLRRAFEEGLAITSGEKE